jgi:hypothetical protein
MFRRDPPDDSSFRTEVRTWLDANLPPALRGRTNRPPPVEPMPWYRVLSRKGWIAPRAVTQACIQLHGAIGFTDEHDIGLYPKRGMLLSSLFGNAAAQRRRYIELTEITA